MIKLFFHTLFKKKEKKKTQAPPPEREFKKKNFFFYIEYEVSKKGDNDKKTTEINSFSAYQRTSFSGRGFIEVIHPALELHQESCSRSQIIFGVIFEIAEDHDIDSAYIPDYNKIVWKKNLDQYDRATLAALIIKSTPHKVKFGKFGQG